MRGVSVLKEGAEDDAERAAAGVYIITCFASSAFGSCLKKLKTILLKCNNNSFRNLGTVSRSLPSRFFITVLVHEIFGIEVEIHSDFSTRLTAAASQHATLFRRHPVCIIFLLAWF